MSKRQPKEGFAFTVVEDDGKNVTIEVSQEDYERELAAGVDKDFLLKPGRYKMKRGGFLARHPELKIKERKSVWSKPIYQTTLERFPIMTLFQSSARRRMRPIFSSALAVSFLLALHPTGLGQASKEPENKKWRQDREAELKREDGWLSLVGLFWLRDGANSVGSARENDVVLPAGSAPARAGQIYLKDGKATLTFRSGVTATVDNQQISSVELTIDDQHSSPVVSLSTVRMTLIKREDRFGIRLRDRNSPARRQFTGLTWFPFNEALRVNAKLERFATPKDVDVPNVLGGVYKMKSPGLLEFQLNGQKLSLTPVLEEGQLFIIFRDKTSGKTTYGGGRFLYADPPGADGNVVLDFNRAYNPPCAFTSYATCPLPPSQNRLGTAIEAGEKAYGSNPGHSIVE